MESSELFDKTISMLVDLSEMLAVICLMNKKNSSTTAGQSQNREWADLPPELLSLIAERAGLFELLSFFRVCNAWYSASSTALAHIVEHELNQGPWFLLYEDKISECQLLTASRKKFTTSIPELVGTTCVATYHALLLLFRQGGSIFFFHVFSRQRIDLPEFPVSELTDHVAAVSSLPTSQDCVVCVVSRKSDTELEAKLLHLGGNQTWIGSKYPCSRADCDTLKCAVYHTGIGKFCFFNRVGNEVVSISTQNGSSKWACVKLVPGKSEGNVKPPRAKGFIRVFNKLKDDLKEMKNKLGLTEDVAISTCGTITTSLSKHSNEFIYNENISDNDDESKNRQFKGVWIQPRLPENCSEDNEAQNS